ncbi:MAG: cytochrome b [Alphaproteobacteria bacterium]|nr:cytochrome b [Alphaproteobacteria bacterium]MBV9693244.1 cytochrome b [Alphaproteobacteria bacterium]
MPWRSTAEHYGNVAMFFHWLIAALIVVNICLGLYFADLPKSDPYLYYLAQIHKSIGLTVLVLSLLRVLWRLVNPVPPLPADMPSALKFLARVTQFLLYVLIVIIPLSGWLMVSASRHPVPTPYFFLFDWPNLPKVADHELLVDTHAFLAWSAIVLVPLHVAGALYHRYWRRDQVLAQMLPWG